MNPLQNMLGGGNHDARGALRIPTFRGLAGGWSDCELAIVTADTPEYVYPGQPAGVVVDGMDVVDEMVALVPKR